MLIDVFKELKLPKPVICGLVLKITSPKGIREFRNFNQSYHYRLHTDIVQLYDGNAVELGPGLYWVVDVTKSPSEGIQWDHYLFKVDENSKDIKRLKRFINQKNSDWIIDALPIIRQNFHKTTE